MHATGPFNLQARPQPGQRCCEIRKVGWWIAVGVQLLWASERLLEQAVVTQSRAAAMLSHLALFMMTSEVLAVIGLARLLGQEPVGVNDTGRLRQKIRLVHAEDSRRQLAGVEIHAPRALQ